MINLGNIIRSLRTQRNWSQEDLARRVGVKKSSISAYENDIRLPSYDVLIELARVFDVSTDYLLEVENRHIIDVSGLSEPELEAIKHLIRVMKYKSFF
ncbi:MAG: helix-turn-helix transcriptional regulator [Eubacterium sp.]|nr:helix-turn-helix transcriptional regulator [Eubacterium sp.]